MPRPRRRVEAALCAKGFEPVTHRDHRVYRLYVDGRKTPVNTKVSTGTSYRTLGAPLVSAMARQVRLSSAEFSAYVQCSLDHDAYVELMRSRGHV